MYQRPKWLSGWIETILNGLHINYVVPCWIKIKDDYLIGMVELVELMHIAFVFHLFC